ncbi:hypothetical protein PYW08_002063 [Mythimna loreyi]|uniref:Uncharacterized protein n=1 Tax=Mythimna loreyi TaxID=667449 RepID=A0ACC2R0N7_9NEOP|nr:hypothetical protein PYW08_002063 [Mythimna loreyi]
MSYGTVVLKIPILFLIISLFLGTNGDVSYVPQITDSVFSCDDFDNDFLNCDDLKLDSQTDDDGENSAKLSGSIVTSKEIDDSYDIEVDIWKVLDLVDEYMYTTRVNFCGSIKDTEAPWAPVFEMLNISSCPISPDIFEIEHLTVSLDSLKDVMCHDFCGEYLIQLALLDGTDKISCHVIQLCIVELNSEDVK